MQTSIDAIDKNGTCMCRIRSTHGIPCPHHGIQLQGQREKFKALHFHAFWTWALEDPSPTMGSGRMSGVSDWEAHFHHLNEQFGRANDAQQQQLMEGVVALSQQSERSILPPDITRAKGRPRGSQNSTQRNPSFHEIVVPQPSRYRCSACRKFGHNRKTCPTLRAVSCVATSSP